MAEYGFEQGVDHLAKISEVLKNGQTYKVTDHIMTLDMAKEVSMIQRTPRGTVLTKDGTCAAKWLTVAYSEGGPALVTSPPN